MSRGFSVNWDRVAAMKLDDPYHAQIEIGRLRSVNAGLNAEIARLTAELAKSHRLNGQFIGWQRDAEITKLRQVHEIERLTAENRHLYNVIKDDALLVERYNAFVVRRAHETLERPRISSTE